MSGNSADILNGVYQDMRGPLEIGFKSRNVLYDQLSKKNKVRMEGGTYYERFHTGRTSARATGLFNGDEVYALTRNAVLDKIRVRPHKIVLPITIPNAEVQKSQGKLAVVKIIEAYPKTDMEGLTKDFESFLLTGATSIGVIPTAELAGVQTLYGPFNAGRYAETVNGLLAHQTPAAQAAGAALVQNLARSQTNFYYNQYADISSWTTEGERLIRSMVRRCNHWAGDGSKVDLIIMDPDTFDLYDESKMTSVRIAKVSDATEADDAREFSLQGARLHVNYDVDRADLTGAAADGITMFLNMSHFEWIEVQPMQVTPFELKIADQDVLISTASWFGNWMCKRPIAQGIVTGGN